MVNRDDCKGCFVHETKAFECSFEPINVDGEKCPCIICLVKSMCYKGCDEFDRVQRPPLIYDGDDDE